MRYFTQVAPFLLSAIFFQSAVFTFLSPLPIFLLTVKNRLWVACVALFTNLAFLWSLNSPRECSLAFLLWLSVGIVFPFFTKRLKSVQMSLLISFLFFIGISLVSLSLVARDAHLDPISYLRSEISMGIDHLLSVPDSPLKKVVEEEGRDTIAKQLLTELPSGILIGVLLCFWMNLLFVSQILRNFIPKEFWSTFKNPEWLVWPTLICGGLFAFSEHAPYYIGLNGFKFLLTLYGFQGLSIISFSLNRYKIFGFFRTLIFFFAIFVTLPLVLALGFFDLWFDFRSKFGQS